MKKETDDRPLTKAELETATGWKIDRPGSRANLIMTIVGWIVIGLILYAVAVPIITSFGIDKG